jgi:hypothetical protein
MPCVYITDAFQEPIREQLIAQRQVRNAKGLEKLQEELGEQSKAYQMAEMRAKVVVELSYNCHRRGQA